MKPACSSGRCALVTGAAGSGMGRSIALTLGREGASVVVNYRYSADAAHALVERLRSRGANAVAAQADVQEADECQYLIRACVAAFGSPDICVIGPGAGWHPAPPHELSSSDATEDAVRELRPVYNLLPLVLPDMYERGWGRIVAIGLHPTIPSPAISYNAAKAARTQALLSAYESAWDLGVTMNVVAPGPVLPIDSLEEAVEQCDHGPAWQQRPSVSPQDVAEGVAWLCSDAGSYVSGCVVPYLFREICDPEA